MRKQHQAVKFNDITEKLNKLGKRGRYLKSVVRYEVMLNAFSIAFDSTVKAETRQKAEHDGLKALDRIPDKHYALLHDMMES